MLEEPNNLIESSSTRDAHERRKHSRYPFTATVETVEAKSQTRIQGRTSDLSRGGCYVDTINSLPAGSLVKICLTKGTRSFESQAEVVYSLAGMGMGVKFTDTDPKQFWTVEKWVAELNGEVLPEPELQQLSEQPCTQQRLGTENFILNELVMELMRQGVLSNAKCEDMLQKLNRAGRAQFDSDLV